MIERKNNRNEFWQIVRAACMIFVVLIHCSGGIPYFEMGLPLRLNFDYYLFLRSILNCGVGVFVFLSGLFVPEVANKLWLKKRLKRILIPYLIWVLFYISVQIVLDVINDNGVFLVGSKLDVGAILLALVNGKTAAPFYYCIVLAALTIITPAIRWAMRKGYVVVLLLITPIAYIVHFLLMYNGISHSIAHLLFTSWISYYALGLSMRNPKIHDIVMKVPNYSVIVAFILGLAESFYFAYKLQMPSYATSQLKPFNFFFTCAVIVLLTKMEQRSEDSGRKLRALVYIGDMSYGIFYLHCFGIAVITKIIDFIGISCEILFVKQAVESISAIAISLLCCVIIQKILGKKLSRDLLGI